MFVTASRSDVEHVEVGIKDLRDHLGDYVNQVHYRGGTITVHRNGKPVAVLISAAEHDRLTASVPAADLAVA